MYHAQHGDLDVPQEFVVTPEMVIEGLYDEAHEGMLLGEYVAGLRCGDLDGLEDPTRRAVLDSLGFNWGDLSQYQRYRFVPMILGLKVFKHLYGFALPKYDFVVPDEPQWPYWMCGMPLGEWSNVVRIQQKMVEEFYPNRKDMLNSMEFLWWIPPGPVDEKYYSPVK